MTVYRSLVWLKITRKTPKKINTDWYASGLYLLLKPYLEYLLNLNILNSFSHVFQNYTSDHSKASNTDDYVS